MTQPIFIVSSGRSGTAALARVLNVYDSVKFHHEYCQSVMLPMAVKYHHGLIDIDEAVAVLKQVYWSSMEYADAEIWGDSAYWLAWIMEPILKLFPNAKFIEVIRDGKLVVASMYYKQPEEIYQDKDVEALRNWIDFCKDEMEYLEPPPEKRYWRVLPPITYNRFQRSCWFWCDIHNKIRATFEGLPNEQKATFRLRDLLDKDVFTYFVNFAGCKFNEEVFKLTDEPYNVHGPINYLMDEEQYKQFQEICREDMDKYGYYELEKTLTLSEEIGDILKMYEELTGGETRGAVQLDVQYLINWKYKAERME